jgi:hypothetical protein
MRVLSASYILILLSTLSNLTYAQTIALWPFDEQQGLYPSSVLSDVSSNDYPLVLGLGGQVVPGKFGNALEPAEYPAFPFPHSDNPLFGLGPVAAREGRKVEPLTWRTARFCALMTSGENHLRNEVGFANAAETKLNLGGFDWTVEFWFLPVRKAVADGVVFEIGTGPRGDSNVVTQLALASDNRTFVLTNQPTSTWLVIPTDARALAPRTTVWRHLAFVYSHRDGKLRHYVDGKEQAPSQKSILKSLPGGPEAYFSIGRDGLWQKPLQGRLDELRFSVGVLYAQDFTPPSSFSPLAHAPTTALKQGVPLLFAGGLKETTPVQLGDRKHLFIDEALIKEAKDVVFQVNPPALAECVIDNIQGPFRKHLNVLEDENGLIRLYYGAQQDNLAVQVSKDGIHFEVPRVKKDLPLDRARTIVIPEPTAMGMVFVDPNAEPEERWKFVSDFHRRGIFLYSSPDGWNFKRHPIAILPFRSGSQSNIFYDEQRQRYVAYHRSDFPRTMSGETQREYVRTETREISQPWPFTPLTVEALEKIALHKRLDTLRPFFLDNGPLTPGGFGVEYPTAFAPDDSIDPVGTDVYVPKAIKYPWAPDTYLAFPLMYFHHEADGPKTRQVLGLEERGRGSGPIEAQLAVSRDGVNWKRYPRPTYVGVGSHHGDPIHQVYLAQGMVRRGSEIWQYYFGEEAYHSTWKQNLKRAVYRVVQRVDGFVSATAPYERTGTLITKPLAFKGNRLVLNVNTGAAGYAQVGILDEQGKPIPGFGAEDCVYINGDFVETEVEWLKKGKDLSSLQGKVVQVKFQLRGASLYSMQFQQN